MTPFGSNDNLSLDRHSSSIALINKIADEKNAIPGIYHCMIPTKTGTNATVYVGLYPSTQGNSTDKITGYTFIYNNI